VLSIAQKADLPRCPRGSRSYRHPFATVYTSCSIEIGAVAPHQLKLECRVPVRAAQATPQQYVHDGTCGRRARNQALLAPHRATPVHQPVCTQHLAFSRAHISHSIEVYALRAADVHHM
jgi:hypothetical protein